MANINTSDATAAEITALQNSILAVNPDALSDWGADGSLGQNPQSSETIVDLQAILAENGISGDFTIAEATEAMQNVADAQLKAENQSFIDDNRPDGATSEEATLGSAAGSKNEGVMYLQQLANENGLNVTEDGYFGGQTRAALSELLDIPEDVNIDDMQMGDLTAALEAKLLGNDYDNGFRLADGTLSQSETANTAADALLAEAHSEASDLQDGHAASVIQQAQDRAEQIRGLDVTAAQSGEGLIAIAKRTMAEQIEARTQELMETGEFDDHECPEDDARDQAALEAAQSIVAVNPHQNWDSGSNANHVDNGEFVVIPETLDLNAPTLDWNALHIEGVSLTTCEMNELCVAETGITETFTEISLPPGTHTPTPVTGGPNSPVQVNDDCTAYYERDFITGRHGWRIDGEQPATDDEVRAAVGDPNARVWQSCEPEPDRDRDSDREPNKPGGVVDTPAPSTPSISLN